MDSTRPRLPERIGVGLVATLAWAVGVTGLAQQDGQSWASTIGRVAPDLPEPQATGNVTQPGTGLPTVARVEAPLADMWARWQPALTSAGFRADLIERDAAFMAGHLADGHGGRGSFSAYESYGATVLSVDWVGRPQPPTLTGPCVTPPEREAEVEVG